jgi:NADPH:quinone reductase-like Zn-dependent oxidoreductase
MHRQLHALAVSPLTRQRLTIRIPKEAHADIERLAELCRAGQLTPVVDRTYPLSEAADAIRYLEAGRARGKIAIAV